MRRRNSREIRQYGCSSWSPSPYSSPASLFGAACSIRGRCHDQPQSHRGHRRWRRRDLDQLTNAATWLQSPLPNSICFHMLQRTFPAGSIAPCLRVIWAAGQRATAPGSNKERRETRVVIETYDDPNRAAKEAAEALVRHILNWGSEEKAPPKQGLGAQGVRGRGFRSRTIRDTPASSRKKSPAEAGHKRGNGKRIQTAQSFERQGRRPSALGHDGRWRWIFANRSLADRPLANRRRRRRRRLPARQVGSGGSAQHRQGCSQCS